MNQSSLTSRIRRRIVQATAVRCGGGRVRRAFSLLELMVVMTIISILLALILPAVHQAREAARRMQCRSHLKQLGVALHNYSSSHGALPPGSVVGDWSWKTFLLPYVDQAATYSLIDFSNNIRSGCYSCTGEVARILNAGLPPLEQTVVPPYYCPSDPQSGNLVPDPNTPTYTFRVGSYLGVSGDSYRSPNYGVCLGTKDPPLARDNGMLVYAFAVRFEHVRDGTSNTLMVGERGIGQAGVVYSRDFCTRIFSPWLPMTGFQFPDPYAEKPTHYWSYHPGGGNFAFGDGSVRFLSYQIAPSIRSSLATADGGEVLGEF